MTVQTQIYCKIKKHLITKNTHLQKLLGNYVIRRVRKVQVSVRSKQH